MNETTFVVIVIVEVVDVDVVDVEKPSSSISNRRK